MKIHLFIIVLALCIPLAHANIAQAIEQIDNEFVSTGDLALVMGQNDSLVQLSFYAHVFSDNAVQGNSKTLFLAENVDRQTLEDKHVIIAGGPCANKAWNWYSDETCEDWPLEEGQSMVKTVKQGSHNVILMAGTTRKDTIELAERLKNYDDGDTFRQGETVVLQSEAQTASEVSELCTPDNTKINTWTASEKIPLEVPFTDGSSVLIELENADVVSGTFDINVQGTSYTNILAGQEFSIPDSDIRVAFCSLGAPSLWVELNKVNLAFNKVIPNGFSSKGWEVRGSNTDDFEITIKTSEVKNLATQKGLYYIKDLEVEGGSLSVTINDKEYTQWETGDVNTINDVPIELVEILEEPKFAHLNSDGYPVGVFNFGISQS